MFWSGGVRVGVGVEFSWLLSNHTAKQLLTPPTHTPLPQSYFPPRPHPLSLSRLQPPPSSTRTAHLLLCTDSLDGATGQAAAGR